MSDVNASQHPSSGLMRSDYRNVLKSQVVATLVNSYVNVFRDIGHSSTTCSSDASSVSEVQKNSTSLESFRPFVAESNAF